MKKKKQTLRPITDSKGLRLLLKGKLLKDIDLSDTNVDGLNFQDCLLENVVFSSKGQRNRLLQNVKFDGAHLKAVSFADAALDHVSFKQAKLESCSFQQYGTMRQCKSLERVAFTEATISCCRFRNALVGWSDFRYAEISNTTFEDAGIDYCDFYRTHFSGVNVFKNAAFSHSSFNFTLFEGHILRKSNLVKGQIIQQQKADYRHFLEDWKKDGPGIRVAGGKGGTWELQDLNHEIRERHAHAEMIFKNLNGIWASNGFLGDANWAYVQGRRAERRRMCCDWGRHRGFFKKVRLGLKITWNGCCDLAFGFGESALKIVVTYVVLVALFSVLIHYWAPGSELPKSIMHSFQNMIAQTPDALKDGSVGTTALNLVQSSIGILLTGIFGFVMANKIRNQ